MKILIIEDDLALSELISEKVYELGFQFKFVHSGSEAINWLETNTPHLIILDYGLPDMNGKEFIASLQKIGQAIPPFLVSTGQGDEHIAVEMMKLGAKDYLVKNQYFLDKLPEVIKRIDNEIINENKRKNAEEELKKSQEQFKKLVWDMKVGVLLQGSKSEMLLANPKALELLGLTEDQLMGKTSFDPDWGVIHEDGSPFPGSTHPVPKAIETCKSIKNVVMGVYRPVYKDRIWLLVSAVPQLHNNGTVRQVVCSFIDITERIQAKEKLIVVNKELQNSKTIIEKNLIQKNRLVEELTETKNELEKLNSEKDKFFSIIAHDLRSPFQGFIGLTELIADDFSNFSSKEIKDLLTQLNGSAINLYKLLINLLDWTRMQQGSVSLQPAEIVLAESIYQNIDSIINRCKQKDIDIEIEVNRWIKVYADPEMLNSILRNLLTNAVKFTEHGGKIIVRAKETDNKTIKISIKDSGIGMSKELCNKLFKIEEQVGRKGTDGEESTGLGLLLCKEFVEKHGGSIWVESKEGFGSTFFFSLPVDYNLKMTNI